MGLRLKNKMEEFFDSISDREMIHNGELNLKVSFLQKYIGNLGDHDSDNSHHESIQKYFNIQLRNNLGEVR